MTGAGTKIKRQAAKTTISVSTCSAHDKTRQKQRRSERRGSNNKFTCGISIFGHLPRTLRCPENQRQSCSGTCDTWNPCQRLEQKYGNCFHTQGNNRSGRGSNGRIWGSGPSSALSRTPIVTWPKPKRHNVYVSTGILLAKKPCAEHQSGRAEHPRQTAPTATLRFCDVCNSLSRAGDSLSVSFLSVVYYFEHTRGQI